nr:immunoglobulin light chain junction region [Macaca mulatta]
CIQSLEFPWTL